jgi:predicted small secreted protein
LVICNRIKRYSCKKEAKMKRVILAVSLVVLLTSGLLAGCAVVKIEGSGNLIDKTFEFSNFTGINAGNGIQVDLTKSSTFNVEITADDNVLEYIEVNKSGDTLRIRPKGNTAFRSATMIAKVAMPDLYELELSGGSEANITGFSSSHDLSVRLSGGSHIGTFITPGDITTGNVDFNLSGGSDVRLTGSAHDLNIDCSGGSHINLESFLVSSADIKLSGGSHATVNVDGTLNVDISGGSEVFYIGEPAMGDINVAWDSDLIKK